MGVDVSEMDDTPVSLGGLGSFTAEDGYVIRYRRFRPPTEPRAVVVCIHGIQSHAGWYEASCRHLAGQGFDVLFIDRRGSGLNGADRGHCAGLGQLRDDLTRGIEHAKSQVPGRPVFLVAISWGGKLAVSTLKEQPRLVDGLALVCPGFFAKIGPSLRERLAIGGSFLIWPRRPIRVPLTEPSLFTENSSWQEYLRQDRRMLRQATARLMMTSVFLDRSIRSAPARLDVPLVMFLAGKDRIIDNAKCRSYFEKFASADKKVIEYAEAHHTLEFENDPRPYFRDLSDWLGSHAARVGMPARLSG